MTRSALTLRVALVTVLVAAVAAPAAQETDSLSLDPLYIDFATPDLAAFTLVGVDDSRVAQPGNLKALATALTNGLSLDGVPEQGVGVELTPALAFGAPTTSTYRGLRDRLSVSLAALRTGDSTRVGIGIRWVPIDGSDPYDPSNAAAESLHTVVGETLRDMLDRREQARTLRSERLAPEAGDFAESVVATYGLPDEAFETLSALFDGTGDPRSLPPADVQRLAFRDALGEVDLADDDATRLDRLVDLYAAYRALAVAVDPSDLDERLADARRGFRDATWNAPVLHLAAGYTARTADGLDGIEGEGVRAFVGGAHGFGTRFLQLVGHVEARLPVLRTLDDDEVGVAAGGRLLLGSATRRVSVEGLYALNDDRLGGDAYRVLVGGELRLADGTYLELATGLNLPEDGGSEVLTLGGLRYAFRSDRRFDGPR